MQANFLSPALAGLKNFWRKSTPITLSTVLLGVSPAIASVKNITVVNSSNSEFHFVVNFEGTKSLNRLVESDTALQLMHTVQVCVPPGADVQLVSANGSGQKLINKTAPEQKLVSMPLAQLSDKWKMRGREYVTVLISPQFGNNLYEQVEIKVIFNGANSAAAGNAYDPGFDKLLASSVANWDECRNWPSQIPALYKSTAQPGPFAVPADWFKVAVNQNGIHQLTFDDLRNAGLIQNSVPSSDVYMYSGGGKQLNPLLSGPRPVFSQIAILVLDGGDGTFQSGDRILFYGESLNRFEYDSSGASYLRNVYTPDNIYWAAVSSSISDLPLRISTVNAVPTGTAIDTMNSYTQYVHSEQENLLRQFNDGLIDNYYTWYWAAADNYSLFIPVSNTLPGQTADVTIFAKTFDTTGFPNQPGAYVDLKVNGQAAFSKNCNNSFCTFQTINLINGMNQFDLDMYGISFASPYFDYIELEYSRIAVPTNNTLDAAFGPYDGLVRVDITDNFTSTPMVFDIDDPKQLVQLTGAVRSGGILSFEASFDLNSANRFLATANIISPGIITKVTPNDLYANSSQTDLVIITTAAFAPALTEYVNYRTADGYSIKVVTVAEIMDNFAFGLYDPTAIRDFLKHSYENYPAPAPSAVLFVGDANYDFLDNLGTGVPNHVPPYLFRFDNTLSDDNYVYFGQFGLIDSDTSYLSGDRGFDMMTARWPVKSVSEISSLTGKLMLYESPATFDNWRTNITIASDDEYAPANPPQVESIHTIQAEQLANGHIPESFIKRKVYSWEYPVVNGLKPDVNSAIVKSVNEGTLILNYVGHGSPDLWAHERVFTRTGDLPRLTNSDKMPVFFAASCAISFFDDPKREGMAEDLLVMPGGAISTIAATRLVYSQQNAAFNRACFDNLLYNDSLTMCEALYATKLQRQYNNPTPPVPNTNDRNYLYFGDPLMRIGMPRFNIVADSVVDSLQALSPVTISGRVTDNTGADYLSDGRLVVSVYDSEREKIHRVVNSGGTVLQSIPYSVTGPTLFRGSATISSGQFNFTFIPPLDIGYGGSGARISMYAVLDTIDATGVLDSISVSSIVSSSTDSTGPQINVSFSGRPIVPGGNVIQKGDRLELILMDTSGINSTGALGHGITLEIDGNSASPISLSELFSYVQDDYTTGTINYDLDEVEAGVHSFKVKAWDNANNSTSLTFQAEKVLNSSLAILDLLNYPNPMSKETSFSFSLTQPVEQLSLEIFTLSGRRINRFERYSLSPAYYDDITWDGRDAYGDRVATGVYLYKATAVPSTGDKVEEFGKIVLINQ